MVQTPEAGDAIHMIDGERFVDFVEFHEILKGYQGESIRFSLIRNQTGEEYELNVRAGFQQTFGFRTGAVGT